MQANTIFLQSEIHRKYAVPLLATNVEQLPGATCRPLYYLHRRPIVTVVLQVMVKKQSQIGSHNLSYLSLVVLTVLALESWFCRLPSDQHSDSQGEQARLLPDYLCPTLSWTGTWFASALQFSSSKQENVQSFHLNPQVWNWLLLEAIKLPKITSSEKMIYLPYFVSTRRRAIRSKSAAVRDNHSF